MKQEPASIAKITRPRLPRVLNRTRLFGVLDKGRHTSVTWVNGPAGSGKTTLIASWIEAKQLPCLWYQMDGGDADLSTFFYYLGLAAKKAAPRFRKPLPLLTPEYMMDVPTFSRRFFENLCTRVKPPFFIVFDNYQEVPPDSPFHAVLASSIAAVPEDVHVICLSRTEPMPAFSRLIAGSKMEIIGWDDLRLSPDESRAIVGLHSRDKQDRKTLEWMYKRTQGWAAGLVLLARAAKAQIIDHGKIDALPPEHIFDYFATELFARADGKVRDFLIKTSVLPTMNPAIAEQLTGNSDAGLILDGLNRRNYFTYKSQKPGITYQYHPLFREFLQMQMKKSLNHEDITRVQRHAAKLLEESGQAEDAAGLFIETNDWQNLIGLILKHASPLISQGRSAPLMAWLESIPREMMEKIPYLLFWRAVCLMPFQPSESRRYFDLAFNAFKQQNDRVGMFLSWSSACDIALHEGQDFSYLDDQIASLNAMLAQDPSFPSREIKDQITMSMFNALIFRQPWNVRTNAWDEQAFELLQKGHDKNLRMYTGVCLVLYHFYMGNMAKAALALDHLQQESRTGDISPLIMITINTVEAIHDYVAAVPESALKAVSKALRLAEETGIHIWDNHLFGHGAGAALSKGNAALANDFLEKMKATQHLARRLDVGYYRLLATWHALTIHDADGALEHVNRFTEIIEPLGFPFGENIFYFFMAQVHHERGDHKKAAANLDLGRTLAKKAGSKLFQYMALLVEAQISFDGAGNTVDMKDNNKLHLHGVTYLRKAFAMAREQNIMNVFGWRSDVMARLCAKALEHGIETEYVKDLIRKRNLVLEDPSLHIENWPWSIRIHTLGRFEIFKDDKPIQFTGKVQKKPLELLKVLVALGGKDVAEAQLIDVLWPDADGDIARISFRTTLHRLRKLLGNDDTIQLSGGQVSINAGYCWVDTWAFERMFDEALRSASEDRKQQGQKSAAGHDPSPPYSLPTIKPPLPLSLSLQGRGAGVRGVSLSGRGGHAFAFQQSAIEKALALYKGQFLPDGAREPWAISMREHMRSRFLQLTLALGRHWEGNKQYEKAAECYQQGLKTDSLAEEFYQNLMVCHSKRGQQAEAVKVYHLCRAMLVKSLGIAPSGKTEEIYASLLNKK